MGKIFCLMGKSSSGKDTIFKKIRDDKELNLKPYGGDFSKKDTTDSVNKIDPALFIYVSLFAILIHFASGNMQHLSAIAISRNYSINVISLFVSLSMIGNVFFKFLTGEIADKKGAIFADISILLLTGLGILFLFFKNDAFLNLLGTFFFGAVFAQTAVGLTLLTKETFGVANFNNTYPIYALLGNAFYAIACSVYGYLYDFTYSYDLGLYIGFILIIICILIIILCKKRINKIEK